MTEAKETIDDLNIKIETRFFCLYQLRIKAVVDLNKSDEQFRLQNPCQGHDARK
jgi:hypothetical protein